MRSATSSPLTNTGREGVGVEAVAAAVVVREVESERSGHSASCFPYARRKELAGRKATGRGACNTELEKEEEEKKENKSVSICDGDENI